jgi:hypothetical protein
MEDNDDTQWLREGNSGSMEEEDDRMPDEVPSTTPPCPPAANYLTQELPPPPLQQDPVLSLATTAVDGQGMWRAWTRVFERPESACLDLLDNCFDASLHQGFHGRVVMKCLQDEVLLAASTSTSSSGSTSATMVSSSHSNTVGISIINNSRNQIKDLEEALTVYKSSKSQDSTQQQELVKVAIGENGVGLKHGCATLSDTSIVITKNNKTVQFGIIAKALQSSKGVFLPSFSFHLRHDPANPTYKQELVDLVQDFVLFEDPRLGKVLAKDLGFGNLEAAIENLAHLIRNMYRDEWAHDPFVFQLVLCKLHHSNDGKPEIIVVDDPNPISPAKAFLNSIKEILPQYYINVPSNATFDLVIDGDFLDFIYWQKRLVELTEFKVNIPLHAPIEELPDLDWVDTGYPISIYCGFDAQRVYKDHQECTTPAGHNENVKDSKLRISHNTSSNCMLYVYSREAGRLVAKWDDARHVLGLSTTGSGYMQGLTIIIDDRRSQLPLMPTKDGIAWSEHKGGQIHKKNMFAWAGAVAQCFWREHLKGSLEIKTKTNGGKDIMKKIILSFAEDQVERVEQAVRGDDDNRTIVNMADSVFNHFDIQWKKYVSKQGKLNIRRTPHRLITVQGPDTLFRVDEARIQKIRAQANAVKAVARRKKADASIDANNHDDDRSLNKAKKAAVGTLEEHELSLAERVGGKRKRKPSIRYLEYESDPGEHDEDLLVEYTPHNRKKAATRKKVLAKKGGRMEESNIDSEQRWLEADIQLKQERLKVLKAERALEAEKEKVRKLEATLQRVKDKPVAVATAASLHRAQHLSSENAKLREELDMMRAERERLASENKKLTESREGHDRESVSELRRKLNKLRQRINRRDETIGRLQGGVLGGASSTSIGSCAGRSTICPSASAPRVTPSANDGKILRM